MKKLHRNGSALGPCGLAFRGAWLVCAGRIRAFGLRTMATAMLLACMRAPTSRIPRQPSAIT